MLLCYITDRSQLREDLLRRIGVALQAGVDLIQIREKDLTARELYRLCGKAQRLPRPPGARILVNTRLDVAVAAKADGFHLPSDAPSPGRFRAIVTKRFLIGVSCHSRDEAAQAEAEGADYVVFGPVFQTPAKESYGPPQGIDRLRDVCRTVPLPVLAVGGVNLSNASLCLTAGAAGIAGISLFQQADDLHATVEALRKLETSAPSR